MKTRYTAFLQVSVIATSIVSVMACTSSLPQPSVVTEVARDTTPATPALTEKKHTAPTATRTATTPRRPTATLTNTPIDMSQPTEPPSSYPAPAKPILLAFGIFGGDGGTSYDIFFGRDMPSLILYSDGQLLIGAFSHTDPDGYSQKMLSPSEMCTLLQRLKQRAFMTLKELVTITPTTRFTELQNISTTAPASMSCGRIESQARGYLSQPSPRQSGAAG